MEKIKSKNINFGYKCNNNCIHCIIGYDARKQFKDRTTDEIKKHLEKAKEEEVEQVIFIGGEITIRQDFFELLEYAKKLGLKVHVETNGRMFSIDKFAKRTLEIMPNLDVMMSFHSSIPEIQDKVTQVEGSFEQSVRGIKNLKKYGLKNLAIDCVVTKYNYKNLEENVKFFKKLGVDELHFTLMRIGGNAQKNLNKVFVSIKEIQPCLFKALKLGEKIGLRVKTYGFPYCKIKGFEKHAFEREFLKTFSEGKTYIFDELSGEINWQKERISIKAKLEKCRDCKYFNVCEGIWKEYLIYNYETLEPIRGNKIKSLRDF
jgi:MoaA/NifB/PqqE/SkfB family radical SAM enzyme